jgi:short-subunit dehydrogenase
MNKLTNKKNLITGASQGLGKALALEGMSQDNWKAKIKHKHNA